MKRSRPDTRFNWRDPNMPVMRDYVMRDGSRKNVIDPDYEHRYREHMMNAAPHPNWRSDPTYNLRKRKR